MIANPPIASLIWMLRYYENLAKGCLETFPDIFDAYFMYDFHMEKADYYRNQILKQL